MSWISVDDINRPNDSQVVLVWYVNGMHGSNGYSVAKYYKDDDIFYRDASGLITHWMPLPKPPNE